MKGNFESLSELAQEIQRIEESKNDYLVPSSQIRMENDREFAIQGAGQFNINDYAHGQIASKLNIPKAYYDRMTEIPNLRTINVNEWMRKGENKNLVRTLDGNVRAFLSDRFRPIDNYDVLSSFIPVIRDMDIKIEKGTLSLSEKKMYVPVIFPKIEGEVKPNDVVQYGLILTNSEVGAGAVDIKAMVWRLVCSNGLIRQSIMRKYHIGARIDGDNADIFADDTIKAELDAFKLRFRDAIKDAINPKKFEAYLNMLKGAVDDKITNVNETVANITKRFGLSEKHNDMIINNMAQEGNMNRYGVANGLTALAHSLDNVDAQYEVEKMGNMVIEMTRTEWNKYALVA